MWMVCICDNKIGNISFYDSKQSEYSFNKPYSEATAETIDQEVRTIIQEAYDRTKQLLSDKRNELELIAQELLKREIIFQTDLEVLIGKRPFERETTYQAYTNRKVSGDGNVDLNTNALKNLEDEHKAKISEQEKKKESESQSPEKVRQEGDQPNN